MGYVEGVASVKTASWVIVDRSTGKAVIETFEGGWLSLINREKYEAVPILEWLQKLNTKPEKS